MPDPNDTVGAWARALAPGHRAVCEALRALIDAGLPRATASVWHGSPVWFIDGNPVVGYSVNAKGVSLLFWNGRAFGDQALLPVGKHFAAQALFKDAAAIKPREVRAWLRLAAENVFDSKAFFAAKRAESRQNQ